ncbi:MAG TPA: hypothetical protein VFA85_18675 [Terriglobales bacterium]|nr:hypothetical protein [Terriglobales bacterium]
MPKPTYEELETEIERLKQENRTVWDIIWDVLSPPEAQIEESATRWVN